MAKYWDMGHSAVSKYYLGGLVVRRPCADGLDLTMAQLAVAWVLQNSNVSAAIMGASRPEQVMDNAKASGVEIPADAMKKIDVALDGFIARDPQLTITGNPSGRP